MIFMKEHLLNNYQWYALGYIFIGFLIVILCEKACQLRYFRGMTAKEVAYMYFFWAIYLVIVLGAIVSDKVRSYYAAKNRD